MGRAVVGAILVGACVAACGGGGGADARGRVVGLRAPGERHRAPVRVAVQGRQHRLRRLRQGQARLAPAVVRLTAAQRAIVEARRRLAGIQPPSEAATLRDPAAALPRHERRLRAPDDLAGALPAPLARRARAAQRRQRAAAHAPAERDHGRAGRRDGRLRRRAAPRAARHGRAEPSRPSCARARGAGPPAAADPLAGPAAALRAAGPGRAGRRAPAPALPRQRRVDHLARGVRAR